MAVRPLQTLQHRLLHDVRHGRLADPYPKRVCMTRKKGEAMSGQELCPLCGEGHVTASVQMLEYEYKGQKTQLPSHYRQCNVCASDFAGMEESKLNKDIVMAFRKHVEDTIK